MKICVGGGNGAAEADLWVLIEGLISAFLRVTSSGRFLLSLPFMFDTN